MNAGQKITAVCGERGWELKVLAERAGVPYSTLLSYVNKRKRTPSLENAYKIAKALGISVDWLANPDAQLDSKVAAATADVREIDTTALVQELSRRRKALRNAMLELHNRIVEIKNLFSAYQPDSSETVLNELLEKFPDRLDALIESSSLYYPQILAWAAFEGVLMASELTSPRGEYASKIEEVARTFELLSEAKRSPSTRQESLLNLVSYWGGKPWAEAAAKLPGWIAEQHQIKGR